MCVTLSGRDVDRDGEERHRSEALRRLLEEEDEPEAWRERVGASPSGSSGWTDPDASPTTARR